MADSRIPPDSTPASGWIASGQGQTARPADDPTPATRYTIRRRQGQTCCEACARAPDHLLIVLWLTAAAARQRGLTHCDQCGQPVVPPEDTPEA
jgi:hypothetical protein